MTKADLVKRIGELADRMRSDIAQRGLAAIGKRTLEWIVEDKPVTIEFLAASFEAEVGSQDPATRAAAKFALDILVDQESRSAR